MLQNYLKVALRAMRRGKAHAAINISGLSIGMAVALLIGIWIWGELSYNTSIPGHGRIAQVYMSSVVNGEKRTSEVSPFPLANELRTHYGSNFRYVVMSTWTGTHLVSLGTKTVRSDGAFMEPDAPDMLSLKMIEGTRAGIREGNTVLLSKSSATAIFGDKDPVGEVFKIDNNIVMKVTGVYEDLPADCSFNDLGFIGSWAAYLESEPGIKLMDDPWGLSAWTLFTEIAPNADMAGVSQHIRLAKYNNCKPESRNYHPEVVLLPMDDWYLRSEFKNGVRAGGRIQYVWLFGIIGVFVLVLACINFMNLSTARSERRAREVGIRKAIGSMRGQLVRQFFAESVLMSFIAFCVALLLISLSLSTFNGIAGKEMTIPWSSPLFWLFGIGFCVITGLIAGSYPALYLSSFQPVKVLKGSFKAGKFASLPRQVLVVLQFTVSVCFIIGTIVVLRQVQYAKDRPMGYSQSGLVSLHLIADDLPKHFDAVRAELKAAGVIEEMAEASGPVTNVWNTSGGFSWAGKDPNQAAEFPSLAITAEFGHTVGWEFVAGRDFRVDFPTDTTALVINEAAVQFIGLKDIVGKTIVWDSVPYHVIGVIKNMVMESPYSPVRPSIFNLSIQNHRFIVWRLNRNANTNASLDKVKTVFAKYSPNQPFDYHFVDEDYAKKFGDEQRTGKLAGVFAGLAVFISCLGLFGLASFMAEQRVKEIGVRKVLGAGVFGLCRLLSRDFVSLVCIALLIALPVSWYGMHRWLESYEYRSGMSWWIFAGTAVAALVITLLTVSVQAVKAAMANPIDSLRSE
jgi:putative ABC transport system permease protein